MSTNNLSIIQSPVNASDKVPVITNWNPLIGYMIYKDQNISSLFYYKIGLQIYLGSDSTGTLLSVLKQRRNGYSVDVTAGKARAFFDVRDIVNSQLCDTTVDQGLASPLAVALGSYGSVHTLGLNDETKIFSLNGDKATGNTQIAQIYVRAIDCYSTNVNSGSICYTPSTPVEDSAFYTQASLDLFHPRSTTSSSVDSQYIQGVAFQAYCLNSVTGKFLSDNPRVASNYSAETTVDKSVNLVLPLDYHTIAFLNGETDFDSKPHSIMVKYYSSTGTTLSTTVIFNQNSDGGANPNTTGGQVDSDAERLIYFGCGPGNLQEFDTATSKPSNNVGWVNYTIRALDSSLAPMSEEVVFVNQKCENNPKDYPTRRLAWRNSLGCYDYFNFVLKSTETTQIKRNKYGKLLGTFNQDKFYYNDSQKGQATRQTTATLKETLNTDYLSEEQGVLIEKLLMSTDVYIIQNEDTTYTQSVVVTDSSFIKKTVVNDKLIQYSITIEYANELNTNS